MNQFKEPTSLLAGTNIILTIGSVTYLYKQIEQLKKDNDELRKNLQVLTSKFQKVGNEDLQTEEAFKTIHQNMKALSKGYKKVEDLRLEDQLDAIKNALTDSDIAVKIPKKKLKKYTLSSSDESSEEIVKKKPKKKENEDDGLIDLFRSKKETQKERK